MKLMERSEYLNKTQRIKTVFLFTVLFVCLCSNIVIYAKENHARQTVKVGYYLVDGYYEKNDDGILSGYGYEFLQKLSGYTGFDYEYIGYDKAWSENLQMLDSGEIDMMTFVQYSEDRAEKFDYSSSPIGYSEAILSTNSDKSELVPRDYSSYHNMRVGMVTGSAINEKMFAFAKQHNFSFTSVYFETQRELENAMESGTSVDAIVDTSMNVLKEDRVLERFGKAPYYVVVKKGNTELLDKINYAIDAMNTNNPAWMTNLYKNYYSINDSYLHLNDNQQLYLEQLQNEDKPITVIIDPDLKPYSYFEKGQPKGILVEYFNKICDFYNLKAEYVKVDTAGQYRQAVLDYQGALVLSPHFYRYEADVDGYNLTQPFLKATFCLLTRTDETYDTDFSENKIAIVKGMTAVEQEGKKDFSQAEFVFYKSADECVEAVKNQEVDGTLLYNYMAYWYLNNNWDNSIQMFQMPDSSINFSIAVSKDCDPMMYELMDYAINATSGTDLDAIVFTEILDTNRANESLWLYIKNRPVILNSIVLCVSILIIAIVFFITKRYVSIQRKKREEAEYDAIHDILTGAYNRLKLSGIMKNPTALSKNVGILMIDVDYFKEINDTFGHDMGDRVLQKLVQILQSQFRGNDIIIRMGGDEFLIILQNCNKTSWISIREKLNSVHNSLNQEFPDKMPLSLSTGLYFSENGINADMLKVVDIGLYHTKKMGRSGCTIVDEKEEVVSYWKVESTRK